MKDKYIIGTRGSLLAVTQCTQTKNELERLTGKEFELKTIKTSGDLNTSVPLWQLEGENFFTKELDDVLKSGDVDFVVHSYKDLGSLRPKGFTLGAITERKFPYDILLFSKSLKNEIGTLNNLVIGTSSPRREANLKNALLSVIPTNEKCNLETKMLRGNVNTRIEKLKKGDYHAIVLAMAGLERLARHPESKKTLKILMDGLDFMILPSTLFPSAASQGALAVECLESRTDVLKLLKTIHHDETALEIKKERDLFNSYGGGCHLAVGLDVFKVKNQLVQIEQGVDYDQKRVSSVKIIRDEKTIKANTIFVGLPPSYNQTNPDVITDHYIKKSPVVSEITNAKNILVSSSYTLDALKISDTSHALIFTSGIKTLKKLKAKGIWCHGTLDSMGEDIIKKLKQSELLKMISSIDEEFTVLSHKDAKSEIGTIHEAYKRELQEINEEYLTKIKKTDVFYWSSFYQYSEFIKIAPEIKNQTHACGLGKTYDEFLKHNIEVTPFISMKEFFNTYKN